MTKRLIINADDFGLSDSVNSAVLSGHKDGILTSATIMTNMPDAEEAVEIAKGLPRLGVGVHLNLFKGRPLCRDSQTKYIVNKNGEFKYNQKVLSLMSLISHNFRKALKAELAQQIQWLIDKGIRPTHLDSHKHIHCFPAIYSLVCELARQFKVNAIRWCYEPKEVGSVPWPLSNCDYRKKNATLRKWAKINRFQEKEFIKTEAFYGSSHLGKIDVSLIKALSLYNRAPTAELMTHPATEDEPQRPYRVIELSRKAELEALCDDRSKKYIRDAKIELVHYGQL